LLIFEPECQTHALHKIILFSSPVLDASFGFEENLAARAEGHRGHGRNHWPYLIRCLALQAYRLACGNKYCGSIESASANMSRYAALASDDCKGSGGLLRLLSVGYDATDTGHWIVFDSRSRTSIASRVFPKNGRAALSPDGVRYATFEAGELRVYSLPKPE
jgi:hypothetical protein